MRFRLSLVLRSGVSLAYEAPAKSTTNRVIDTGIGALAGGGAAAYSPKASFAAGGGFFASEAVAGGSAVGAGALINLFNGDPWQNNLGYAFLIGVGSPLLSGKSLLIGTGYLGESSIGAANALALNSAVFGSIGILADPIIHPQGASGLAGPPSPYGGGILINPQPNTGSACQVSSP